MGLRFRKSFNIGGGFRVNLSTRGVGASWGVPGFRVGTGPSGTRVYGSIPGTGIGWSTGIGGAQRISSPTGNDYRQLVASEHEVIHLAELQRSRYEVELHEQYVKALQSLHQEGWSTWDWHAIARSPIPHEPIRQNFREAAALQTLHSYRPGFASNILGTDRKLAELQHTVLAARAQDEQEYATNYAAFREHLDRSNWLRKVAHGIIAGDPEACQIALDHLGPFQTFQRLGSSLNVCITRPWCVEAWLTANNERVVPNEMLSLTPAGEVSRRVMPIRRYWAIYQDHVCSAALRIAREVFALLPVPVALVHVGYPRTNAHTGMTDHYSILSVAFDRDTFAALKLNEIDPSDSMSEFEHRMKFTRDAGFAPVELLTPDDLGAKES
ncbi:MAG: DUF4236 domain-containing protein [Polyangiaceae bacterium]